MIRREVLQGLGTLALWPGMARAGEAVPFSEVGLHEIARQVASRPYAPRPMVPQPWRDLNYGQYKSIRPRPDRAVWSGTDAPLQLDLFPPGLYFPRAVEVNLVEDGLAVPLPFDWRYFDRPEGLEDLSVDDSLGYAGLRLRTDLSGAGGSQEYAVFQGASYFRMIGVHEIYGLSARGLAIDTAGPDGEEFPEFTRFWIERPEPGAQNHVLHALMESPSITGLYTFVITPGDDTGVAVRATLYPRRRLGNVGIAPLTSMFLFDDTRGPALGDYRRAVHDSDGLAILNGNDEQIWRPLDNPEELQLSHFMDDGPKGFGLFQRARSFDAFGDIGAKFERRPSLWIEPGEDWGRGSVMLAEIPSRQENFDNIVAYWRPADPLEPGRRYDISYRMTWTAEGGPATPVAEVAGSYLGRASDNPEKTVVAPIEGAWGSRAHHVEVRIDYAPHPALPADPDALDVLVRSNRGRVSPGVLQVHPETGAPRLAFSFDPGDHQSVELRAQLSHEGRAVSEVWLFRWTA